MKLCYNYSYPKTVKKGKSMKLNKKTIILLSLILFLVFETPIFSQTITVYDGSTTGVDTDWWGSSTSVSVNWSDNINWSNYSDEKWYEYDLEINVSGDYSSIKTGVVPQSPTTAIPPKSVTITGISLSENRIYRVRIRAYHGSYGTDHLQIGTDYYSDGFVTDFTNPTVTRATSEYDYLSNTYTVSWVGSDTSGPSNSGIANYDVQYSTDQATWENRQSATSLTYDTFNAPERTTYYFRVRARDNAGNLSDWRYTDHTPPTATITGLSSVQTSNTFSVNWSATDNESSVAYYDVQYKEQNGQWTTWKNLTTATSATFTGNNGQSYYFRVRAYDSAGNRGEWSSENAAMTTINSMNPSISLSVTPSQLSFSSTDNQANLTIGILATGGNVTISSITEKRNYPRGAWRKNRLKAFL